MKKIGLIVFFIIFLHYSAFTEEAIEVKQDADTKALSQVMMNITVAIMMPCVRQLQNGKTDQEITNLLSDELKKEELQKKCLCMYKDKIREKLKDCDTILLKHPQWRGKTLVIREVDCTTTIHLEELEKIKKVLSKCK